YAGEAELEAAMLRLRQAMATLVGKFWGMGAPGRGCPAMFRKHLRSAVLHELGKVPSAEGAAKVTAPFHYPDPAMTPLERYQADLQRPDFFHDAAQETAVRHLQRLYDDLVAAERSSSGLLGKLFGKKQQGPIKGLYFWEHLVPLRC